VEELVELLPEGRQFVLFLADLLEVSEPPQIVHKKVKDVMARGAQALAVDGERRAFVLAAQGHQPVKPTAERFLEGLETDGCRWTGKGRVCA